MNKTELKKILDSINKKREVPLVNFYWDIAHTEIERISSWLPSLDWCLWWWLPMGRIIEIYWNNSSWKSTAAIQLLVEVQKSYPDSFQSYIDSEHSFDWEYARALWLDTDRIIFSQPDTAEEALDLMYTLAWTEWIRAVIFDSVAQIAPSKEVNWNSWDAEMWMRARLLSQAMRKLPPVAEKNKCLILLINQTRTNLWQMWGNPEVTPWWEWIKFAASVRIRTATKKDKTDSSIWITTFKIEKNKVGVPFRTTDIEIEFWKWFNTVKDLLTLAKTLWVIYQSWASYSFRDKKWQGNEKMVEEFMNDIELRKDIEATIRLYDNCKDIVDKAIKLWIISENTFWDKKWEKEWLMRKDFLENPKLLKELSEVIKNSI